MAIIPSSFGTAFKIIQWGKSDYINPNFAIICQSSTEKESMDLSHVRLTSGSAMPFLKEIDSREMSYSLSGPCLVNGTTRGEFPNEETSQFLNDIEYGDPNGELDPILLSPYSNSSGYITKDQVKMLDVPGLSIILLLENLSNSLDTSKNPDLTNGKSVLYWLSDSDETPVLDSINLNLSTDGLSSTINFKGGIYDIPHQTQIFDFAHPMRESNWYDFASGISIDEIIIGNDSVYDIPAFITDASISVNYEYLDIDYIGKTQSKSYIPNGGVFNFEITILFDFDKLHTYVDRQDGFDAVNSVLYSEEAIKTFPYRSSKPKFSLSNFKFIVGSIEDHISSLSSALIDQVSNAESSNNFGAKLARVFNTFLSDNISNDFVINNFGQPTLNNDLNNQSSRIITDVSIDRKMTFSTITISGQKLFN